MLNPLPPYAAPALGASIMAGVPQMAQASQPKGMFAQPAAPRWQDQYAKQGWQSQLTKLSPQEEAAFGAWAQQNHAPITPDYDMRGFWKNGGATSINPNDGLPHYSDTYKTPLHQTFSGESIYADPRMNPPMWNDRDQLVAHDGTVLFDERQQLHR